MATLVLTAAGQVLGGSIGGGLGAALGGVIGAIAGQAIDNALFGQTQTRHGPRLESLTVQTSSEGAAIPRVYGRTRISGQVIWATELEEVVTETTQGGKGAPSQTQVEYRYFANLGIGLCEGPIHRIGRIWADGNLVDQSKFTIRVHPGHASSLPDSLISAKQGESGSPAYRDTAYVVFDRIPLDDFGNRIPQFSFEVIRVVEPLETSIGAVTLIPGSTEFGYLPRALNSHLGLGEWQTETSHTTTAPTNIEAALDDLQALCPALKRVSLVVAWFGDDLRCGHCTVRPKVEAKTRSLDQAVWSVGGLARIHAEVVSQHEGRVAFGGTPSDESVVELIRHLTARGIKVTFYPFIMMDIPHDNTLPGTDGSPTQPAYPWRGRITCSPQAGSVGSVDGTSEAATQVANFIGAAENTQFVALGEQIFFVGPQEWTLRRMILHYAHLCVAAGGVEAFLIGSELRGLTRIRGASNSFPVVDALVTLAADVKSVVGSATLVSYAADWSEYFGHHPSDGTNDAFFHLDPLWSSPDVDFIGIDMYWPLSDWRDGDHIDQADALNPYDSEYLTSRIRSGEGYDWYYRSQSDRDNQNRTIITDGAYNKPWMFRYKDILNWWSNLHYDRPGGIEVQEPTAWVPRSKPFWFTECGCPAVDRGSNQPNVFVDPKSSESFYPYYSARHRDDLIQRRYLQSVITHFAETELSTLNPESANPGVPMIASDAIFVWTWDARPFPEFPLARNVWSDGANWYLGHWVNGRFGSVSVSTLITHILLDYGIEPFHVTSVPGLVDGYIAEGGATARDVLEPLLDAFSIRAHDTGTTVRFVEESSSVATFSADDLALENADDVSLTTRLRDWRTEPDAVRISFRHTLRDYEQSTATVGLAAAQDARVMQIGLSAFSSGDSMLAAAQTVLDRHLSEREHMHFALPPDYVALEVGDRINLKTDEADATLEIVRVEDAVLRRVDAVTVAPRRSRAVFAIDEGNRLAARSAAGAPDFVVLDLPLLTSSDIDHQPRVAATVKPWLGDLAVYGSSTSDNYSLIQTLTRPTILGTLLHDLGAGVTALWDDLTKLEVQVSYAVLSSVSDSSVLAGANALAVECRNGEWEVLQFANAVLIGLNTYRLSRLLRAQVGTDGAMRAGAEAGARVVLLDDRAPQLETSSDDLGRTLNVRVGPLSRPLDDPSYLTQTQSFQGLARRPYSPVHLRAYRMNESGDIEVRWIRRTRIDGDSWTNIEVPLGESTEAYQVTVYNDDTVLRQLSVSVPVFSYPVALQLADFGVVVNSLDISVAQLSSVFGPGTTIREMLHV